MRKTWQTKTLEYHFRGFYKRRKGIGILGKIDTVTKNYMKDPVVFADAFNKYLYHGEQVIKPESLAEVDTAEIVLPYGEGKAGVPEQRYRDVLKLVMTDGDTAYCILGCEGQSTAHYAMPVKNMVYDAMQLAHQVTETGKSHRRKNQRDGEAGVGKPSPGEYLGGFYKTDKLLPVITLTIYFGPEKWDGPLALKEMYAAADETIMQYVPDYKVNLIAPDHMTEGEIGEFRSSLKQVMLYIKYSKDKEKLREVTRTEPGFRSLERQAAEVINVTTNSRLKYPEGEEEVDMCVALEEMRNDSKQEGRKEGRKEGKIEGTVETYKEVGYPLQEAARRIAGKFGLTIQQAEEVVKKYWQ